MRSPEILVSGPGMSRGNPKRSVRPCLGMTLTQWSFPVVRLAASGWVRLRREPKLDPGLGTHSLGDPHGIAPGHSVVGQVTHERLLVRLGGTSDFVGAARGEHLTSVR